jgi:hypothetical protein
VVETTFSSGFDIFLPMLLFTPSRTVYPLVSVIVGIALDLIVFEQAFEGL